MWNFILVQTVEKIKSNFNKQLQFKENGGGNEEIVRASITTIIDEDSFYPHHVDNCSFLLISMKSIVEYL